MDVEEKVGGVDEAISGCGARWGELFGRGSCLQAWVSPLKAKIERSQCALNIYTSRFRF